MNAAVQTEDTNVAKSCLKLTFLHPGVHLMLFFMSFFTAAVGAAAFDKHIMHRERSCMVIIAVRHR